MQEISKEISKKIAKQDEEMMEEEWIVKLTSKDEHQLSKIQANVVMQAMSQKEKFVIFKTFAIPIPYITAFYMIKRYRIGVEQFSPTAKEEPYVPIPKEKFEEIKKKAYAKIGKKI